MLDFLTELIIDFWNWLHKTDLYYTPYKTNIIGEHRYNEKTDKAYALQAFTFPCRVFVFMRLKR